jgi:hypothetical protein
MITVALATAFFLLFHLWIERRTRRVGVPFHVALKISRGIASVFLVLVGFSTLFAYWEEWRLLFLEVDPARWVPLRLVLFITGHLVADMIWLAWGLWGRGSRPRQDLVVHHVVGLAACGAALHYELGYLLVAIAMTTELMPVATGLGGWGKARDDLHLEEWAARLSLAALFLWRIPFWLFILWMTVSGRVAAALPGLPGPIAYIILAVASALVLMDAFWSRKIWQGLREMRAARKGARGPQRDGVSR